jgi:outer membrane protein TolC
MIRMISAIAGLALAMQAGAADLLSIYQEARVQDAQYAAAKAQFIAAQERLPQGRALLLPNANFEAGYNTTGWTSSTTAPPSSPARAATTPTTRA